MQQSPATHPVHFQDWGLIDYKAAWDKQEQLFLHKTAQKLGNRSLANADQAKIENDLVFCEHPHVYTLGKSGTAANLLVNDDELKRLGASFYHINRGGDITYHGPGQIVCYPIIDLDQFFNDIHQYLRLLEEAVIQTIAVYGLKGERLEGYTGVWLDAGDPARARKICAMGVRCSRWVTMHGLAFNVNTDLSYFDHIIPCGIADKQVTSLARELGYNADMQEVKQHLKKKLASRFDITFV